MTHPDPVGQKIREAFSALDDQPAEVQIEYRMDRLMAELDELCRIASHTETHDLINRRAAVDLTRRALLMVNLLKAHDEARFTRAA